MSHYRANLRDIEFNLFDVHRLGDRLEAWPELDEPAARQILGEMARFAATDWAASFVESDRVPVIFDQGEVRLPPGLKKSLAAFREMGWDRIGLPAAMGGTEVPPSLFWATQELLLGANATATMYAGGPLFARVLWEEGTLVQRALAELAIERGWSGTMALTEPDAGSDVGAGTTRAIHLEGDSYHLEGVKRFITGGDHDTAENILHLVLARAEGAAPGTKGLSMFVVPKFLVNPDRSIGDRNGIVVTAVEHKMGLKGSATCELTLGADRRCLGYLVGGRHDGIRQMFRVIEHARMTIGTKSAATLSTGYLTALNFARDRVQGADLSAINDKTAPRVPIISHPDVRRMLIRQKAYAEGLRALVLYAATCQDRFCSDPNDRDSANRAEFLLPLVKGYASEKAYELLASSLQVLGGSGYTQDYPVEQYLRDAKIDTVYEGTTGIQALDLFFRKICRDQGQTMAKLAAEVAEFVKTTDRDDPISSERERLGEMLDDARAHIGVMVGHLSAAVESPAEIYRIGLHTNALLESLAEVVISWQLLRQAVVAAPRADADPFYAGKMAAARFFVSEVGPLISIRRAAAEAEDGSLMELDLAAF